MTSVTERIRGFLAGPQGRKLMERGKRQMRKPSTQQKLRQFADRVRGRSGGRRGR